MCFHVVSILTYYSSSCSFDQQEMQATQPAPQGDTTEMVKRPPQGNDKGTSGTSLELAANHFEVFIKKESLFHYCVKIEPPIEPTTLQT
jgi:hypothetical protein